MRVRVFRTAGILLLHACVVPTLALAQRAPQSGASAGSAKVPGETSHAVSNAHPSTSHPTPADTLAENTAQNSNAAGVDQSIDPCIDFYQYACGNWMKNNPIPADYPQWLSFSQVYERNLSVLHTILEKASVPGNKRDRLRQQVGDFYASCMDEETINKAGWAPLKPEINRVEAIRDKSQMAEFLGYATQTGIHPIFHFWAAPDTRDSNRVIAYLDSSGLTLPGSDYYQKDDPDMVRLRQSFREHLQRMFGQIGQSPEMAAQNAATVLRIETELAKAAGRAPRKDANGEDTMTLQQINSLAPNLQMARYLDATGAPRPTVFNISNRDFFAQLNSLLESTPLQDWKVYLTWQLLYDAAPWLSSGFVQEDFSFRQALTGMKEAPPRWKRCVSAVDSSLGEVLGRVYIDETFTAYDKQRVLEIANALEKTLAHEISALNWLTPRTRDEALAKLASVRNKIGYPDAWHDYAALTIVRGDLLGNLRRAALFESKRQLHNIGRPTDKTEWAMSPSAVNAYYSPEFNEIVFPAGILQPPFFDRSLDQAANIGAIGFVIAHELTHGFDAKGWSFDSKGIRREWWPGEDKQQYKTRAGCISDEYSSFVAVDNQHLNGRLTLDENMADNRGAQIALMAFHNAIAQTTANQDAKIDDRIYDQQFFLRFASVWCENSTPELSRLAIRADPHSPGRWRVNGVVRNMPEFQKAFSCKPGQPMALQNACTVW